MLPYHGLGFTVGESLYYRLKLTSKKPLNDTYYVNQVASRSLCKWFQLMCSTNINSFWHLAYQKKDTQPTKISYPKMTYSLKQIVT